MARITAILLFTLVVSVHLVYAQNADSTMKKSDNKKNFYRIGVGYNFASGIGVFKSYKETSDYKYEEEFHKGSYGKGVELSFSYGRRILSNFGMELEVAYLVGSRNTLESQYYINNFPNSYTIKEREIYKANTFKIHPQLFIEVPFSKNTTGNALYGKFGYVAGFGKTTSRYEDDVRFDNGGTTSGSYEYKFVGGVVSGITSSLGLRFNTQDDVSIYIELVSSSLSRTFDKRLMTEFIQNSQNTLDDVPVYYKETVYVDILRTDPNEPIDYTKPSESLAYKSNYNSLGFKIGIIQFF